MYKSTSRRCAVLDFPPALSISSLFSKDSFAQFISPSSSFCRTSLKPIEVYQSAVARTSGTLIIGTTVCGMAHSLPSEMRATNCAPSLAQEQHRQNEVIKTRATLGILRGVPERETECA